MDATIINGVVALVGIGVGYLGGVQKGKADLDVERERTRQLREERADNQLQHRMGVYHDFLNVCTDMVRIYQSGGARTPLIQSRLSEIESHLNGVLAFGAAPTHEPGQRMLVTLRAFNYGPNDLDGYNAARNDFLAAAHADVGPGSLT
jgi:hypothetical protein